MPGPCAREMPPAVPVDLVANAPSARRLRVVQQRFAAAVCLLLLVATAAALSLYGNVPPVWNPTHERKVKQFYNPHPPLAYRLAGTNGPLHRAAAWCHGLAVLLMLAPLCQPLLRLRRNAPIEQRSSRSVSSVCRRYRVQFALGIFHLATWAWLVQNDDALSRATAVLVALLGTGLGAVSVRRHAYRHSLSFRWPGLEGETRIPGASFAPLSADPATLTSTFDFDRPLQRDTQFLRFHAPLLLSLGLALSVAGALLYASLPPTATATAPLQDSLRAPDLAPHYAREWALLLGATSMLAVLVVGRVAPASGNVTRRTLFAMLVGAGFTTCLNATVFWYRQPLPEFGEAVPGVLYHSGQPGVCSLALAQRRYGFRTLVYVHPDINTTAHTEEVRFARRRGIRLIDAVANDFRPEVLFRLMRDPSAHPVLLHCIEGKNRTPAWLAVYRVVEQGWSPPDAYAEMERISGRRLKTYIVEWVEKQTDRLKGAAPLAKGQAQLP